MTERRAVPHPWAASLFDDVRRVITIPLSEVDFVIRSEAETVVAGVAWEPHVHEVHELLWSTRGALSVRVGARVWALPAGSGVWIPAGTEHHANAAAGTGYRAVYVSPRASPDLPDAPLGITVSPLLREILSYLDGDDAPAEARDWAERLGVHLLTRCARDAAPGAGLRVPQDARIRAIAAGIVANPGDRTPLAQWARDAGLSERTIARAFVESTGLSFTQWRSAVRVHCSMALLAEGMNVAEVAELMGYETSSAFIAAFRRATGSTPGSLR
ncbi:MAG: helix-turn-helix domain-containing protein [Thermoleophilia bacterium]